MPGVGPRTYRVDSVTELRAGEILLFVYGTFLMGEPNHALLDGARPLGEARSEAAFELIDLGDFPAMVGGGEDAVEGEIYAVDSCVLARLDEHEDHPDYYCRSTIAIEGWGDAVAYLLPPRLASEFPRIPSADWRARRRQAS